MVIYMYNGGTGLGLKYALIVAAIVSDIHLKSFNNSQRTSSPKIHWVRNRKCPSKIIYAAKGHPR